MKYQPSLSVRELEFMANSMDVHQFRAAIRAGAFRVITVVADGPSIHIEGQPLSRKDTDNPVALITARERHRRRFRSVEAAMLVLKSMGAKTVITDLSHWQSKPVKRSFGGRPDMAERLRAGHAVAREQKQLEAGETLLLGAGGAPRPGALRRQGDADWFSNSGRAEAMGVRETEVHEIGVGESGSGGGGPECGGGWSFGSEAYREEELPGGMDWLKPQFHTKGMPAPGAMEIKGPSTQLAAKQPKRRRKLTEEEALRDEKLKLFRRASRQNSPEVTAAIRTMLGLDDDPDC